MDYYKEMSDVSASWINSFFKLKIPFSNGDTSGKVEIDDAGGRRSLITQIYIFLALPLLQPQIQLLTVILLVFHGTARHAENCATAEDAVSETGADIDAFVHLAKDLEIGAFAYVEPCACHFVQPA
jgi:hypothetical protein